MEFQVEWKDAPGVRDSVLARTWCALTIRIRGEPVTRVFDRRTRGWRDSVHGAVFPLCAWVVDNLWFLLYEPYRWPVPYGSRDLARNDLDRPWVRRHSLLAAREGGALPDLTIFRDGDAVLARWLQDGGDASHPFLRFVQEGQAHLSPEIVRAGIEKFVETVLERVSDTSHAEVAQLRDDWANLRRLTPEETNLCAWSARLGINAHYGDELPDSEAERLKSAIRSLEGRIAADLLDATAIGTVANDVDWIDGAHRRTRTARRTSAANGLRGKPWQGSIDRHERTAYAAGYRHARALRERSGFGTGRILDLECLMRRLGWANALMVATDTAPSTGVHAVVDYGRDEAPVAAAYPSAQRTSERFLLARSLFLQGSSSRSERRLVTASHTWDQRASRAFAAELLAPADALQQRIRSEAVSPRDVAQFADEFLVDPAVVERQVENHALARVDHGRPHLRQW